MSKRNDGGPAFACSRGVSDEWDSTQQGMSLRDYFAAHAPIGLLRPPPDDREDRNISPEDAANLAYAWADAMLAERNRA